MDPAGLQEARPPGDLQIPLGFPTSVDQILQWLFPFAPKAPPPNPSPAPKGETTQKPSIPTPATPKTDGQGSTGPTGPTSLPTPQEKPPAAAPQQEPRAVDDNGFAPYNADQQRAGGFAAGVSIGLVPFGSLVVNTLIANGILAQGTPEAREGLAVGQAVGGILGLFWGGGKAPSAAPLQAPRPVPATVGGGASPPLVVVPDGKAVLVGAGGVVTLAVAVTDLVVSLTGPGKQKPETHHIATNKNEKARQKWTSEFERPFDKAGVSLDDPANKVLVLGHKGPHPPEYHEAVYERLSNALRGLEGSAAREALVKELDLIGKEVATSGTYLNRLVTKGSP